MGIIECDWVWSSLYWRKLEGEQVNSSSIPFLSPNWVPHNPGLPSGSMNAEVSVSVSLIKSDSIHNASSDLFQWITLIRFNYIIIVAQWPGTFPLLQQWLCIHSDNIFRMEPRFLSFLISFFPKITFIFKILLFIVLNFSISFFFPFTLPSLLPCLHRLFPFTSFLSPLLLVSLSSLSILLPLFYNSFVKTRFQESHRHLGIYSYLPLCTCAREKCGDDFVVHGGFFLFGTTLVDAFLVLL